MESLEPVVKYNLRKRQGQPLHLQLGFVAVQPKMKRKRIFAPLEDPVANEEMPESNKVPEKTGKQRKRSPQHARKRPKKPDAPGPSEDPSTSSQPNNKRNHKRFKPANPEIQQNNESQDNQEVLNVEDQNITENQTETDLEVVAPQLNEDVTVKTVNQNNTNSKKVSKNVRQYANKTTKSQVDQQSPTKSTKPREVHKTVETIDVLNTSQPLDTTQTFSSQSRVERQNFVDSLNAKLTTFLDSGNQSRVKEECRVVSEDETDTQEQTSSKYDQSKIRNVDSVLLAGQELNVSVSPPAPAPLVSVASLCDGNFKLLGRNGDQITVRCKLCCQNYRTLVQTMKSTLERHMQTFHSVQTTNDAVSPNTSIDRTHNSMDVSKGDATVTKLEDVVPTWLNQTRFNHLLMNYVIKKRLSYTVTEDADFKCLMKALVRGSSLTIPTPFHLMELLETRYNKTIANLQQELKSISHICISADLFTKDCRTYLAIMSHFIDPVTYQRQSRALIFSKSPGNQVYTNSLVHKKVREVILDKFGIPQDKVVRFMANSVLALGRKRSTDRDLEGSVIVMNLACKNDLKCGFMMFVDRQDSTHQSCYAHKLERLAAHYVTHCLDITNATRILIQFWSALQNAPNVEATFVDTIFCSASLQCPQNKKFHLSHLSIRDVLECVETALKMRLAVNQAMQSLHMSPLVAEDFTFFEELTLVLKPVLQSLQVMRKIENCYLGIILPTLRALQFHLTRLKDLKSNCEELRNSIVGGIERRFTNIIDVKSQTSHPLVLATMSLPPWKQTWLRDISQENREFCKELLIKEVARLDAETEDSDPEVANEEDGFFDALREKNEQLRSEQRTMETCRFIEDDRRKIEIIDQYPRVKRVFLKYNTILPTAAPLADFLCDSNDCLLTPFNCSFPERYFEMLFVLRNETETN